MKPGSSIYITDRKFLLINSKHSQSALEYMMTYGWAILIIVIVAAVLYSLGIFNPTLSIPKATVTGFAGLGSVSAFCTSNGVLRIQIGNSLGVPIEITQLNGTDSDTGQTATFTPNSTVDPNPIIQPDSSYAFSLSDVCPSAGSSYSIASSFEYTEIGQTFPGPYFSTGTLSGSSASVAVPAFVSQFNGQSSYIHVPTLTGMLGGQTPYTFTAWVSLNVTRHADLYIFGDSSWGPDTAKFFFRSGPPVVSTWNSTGPYNAISAGSLPQNNTFVMVAGGYAGPSSNEIIAVSYNSNMQYSTGSPENDVNFASSPPLYIGLNVCCDGWLQGDIVNVQFYNQALSQAQINQLFSEGMAGSPLGSAGLVGYWPLNGTAKDYSGNNNNGVATNVIYTSNYQNP